MANIPRIALTAGEPAGIGPDLIAQIAQHEFSAQLVVIADKTCLLERAKQLALPLELHAYNSNKPVKKNAVGTLNIIDIPCNVPTKAGQLNPANAQYVLETLTNAAEKCLTKEFNAVVTGPVHKGIINAAGISFQGHTEFFANLAQVSEVVMLLASQQLRVALVTTHLPLSKVPAAITKEKLSHTLKILLDKLQLFFGIKKPRILVCGLNPHAGENGYLGQEEITTIIPVIKTFKQQGADIIGPLPADTIFTEKYLRQADAILAMYHDQGLPVLKHMSFGEAVNITLGLPFIRTSVDHGTALDIAGTGKAEGGSFCQAIVTAIEISGRLNDAR